MFNLVKNRYLFLIISLIIIIPGTLSLIFKGLNVGLDFAGGANVELRPQTTMKVAEVQNLVKPFNLQDLQIVTGDDTAIAANKTVWVRLNTWIDTNVQTSIQNTLQQKYPEVNVNFDDVPLVPPKKVTIVTITKFSAVPNTDPNSNDDSKRNSYRSNYTRCYSDEGNKASGYCHSTRNEYSLCCNTRNTRGHTDTGSE